MNDYVFNFRLWKGYKCWKNIVRFQKNHSSRSVQFKFLKINDNFYYLKSSPVFLMILNIG